MDLHNSNLAFLNYINTASQAILAKKYRSLKLSFSKNNLRIFFLSRCKKLKITPKFIHITCKNNSSQAQQAVLQAKIHWLNLEIKQAYSTRDKTSVQLYILHLKLTQSLHPLEWDLLYTKVKNDCSKLSESIRSRHNKKISILLKAKEEANPRSPSNQLRAPNNNLFYPQSSPSTMNLFPTWINNSTISFSPREEDILKKGKNFCPKFSPSRNDMLDLGVAAENALGNANTGLTAHKISHILDSSNKFKSDAQNSDMKIIHNIKSKMEDGKLIAIESDKGGSFGFYPISTYVEKIQDFLKNNATPISQNPTEKLQSTLRTALKNNDLLFPKKHQDLITMNPHSPVLRGVIKVHKINQPIRPIVNNINSPFYKVSKFINNTLKELSFLSPQHTIQNTFELITEINKLVLPPSPTISFVSFDIINMFSSIPVPDCINVLEEKLFNSSLHGNITTQLINILKLILGNNYYCFDNQFFKQENGLAMGSPLSPVLADIYMDHFETMNIINPTNIYNQNILLWKRYVDDIFCIWNGPKQSLYLFLSYLNSCNNNIQFTLEEEINQSINFLDLVISHNNHNISFDIYRKPTFSNSIIPYSSFHHHHHKLSSFFSMLYRLNTTPLSIINYQKEFSNISFLASVNGFSTDHISKLNSKVQDNIFKRRCSTLQKSICIKHWRHIPYLGPASNKIGTILMKNNIQPSFQTPKNLLRIINSHKPLNQDVFSMNLQRSGIYKLKCPDCNSSYIGQTGRKFLQRIKEHIADSKKPHPYPRSNFATHLCINNHKFTISSQNVEFLKFCDKGYIMHIWEKLYILLEISKKGDLCLNEKPLGTGPIISSMLHLLQ